MSPSISAILFKIDCSQTFQLFLVATVFYLKLIFVFMVSMSFARDIARGGRPMLICIKSQFIQSGFPCTISSRQSSNGIVIPVMNLHCLQAQDAQ